MSKKIIDDSKAISRRNFIKTSVVLGGLSSVAILGGELKSYEVDVQEEIARETAFLYAPMAHRLGLCSIKTELEDLSLKHTQASIYKEIARKLNETKRSRDSYIEQRHHRKPQFTVKQRVQFFKHIKFYSSIYFSTMHREIFPTKEAPIKACPNV